MSTTLVPGSGDIGIRSRWMGTQSPLNVDPIDPETFARGGTWPFDEGTSSGSLTTRERLPTTSTMPKDVVLSEHTLKVRGMVIPSLVPAISELEELARLPENWDMEGGVAPTAVAVAAACSLMAAVSEQARSFHGQRLVPSSSAPIADGGIEVEWEGPGVRVDVVVTPEGSYSYLVQRGVGSDVAYSEAHTIPRELLTNLVATTILAS